MENNNNPKSALPETVLTILNALSGMNAEFSFDFDNIELQMPAGNPEANTDAKFRLNGSLRVRTGANRNQA